LNRGFIKPEDIEPDIYGLEFYMDAFAELSTSRPSGLGVSPIPFTAIAEYFRIYELKDFDEFAAIIRRLDNVFLELNAKEEKVKGDTDASRGNKNTSNPNKGGRPRG
jgi:hypothetical protein